MVITHKTNTKLEDAYYNIKWRLDNAGIKYETENNIIPQWDPNAKDEFGNQLPKPDPDTVGTGTAWIKIFFQDRKQVFVYFCCHLVECSTCTYDRFITVYNYTDDVMDTNLQGMVPALTLKYYADKDETDGDRTVYFDTVYCASGKTYHPLYFRKPRSLADTSVEKCKTCGGSGKITMQTTVPSHYGSGSTINYETTCTDCHGTGFEDGKTVVCDICNGKGVLENEVTVPSGNPYKKPVTVKVKSTCSKCNGTGRISTNNTDDFCHITTLDLFNFYVKKSQTIRDTIDNRINDGMRIREDGINTEYDDSDKNEGGIRKFAKRIYTNDNSYDPDEIPVDSNDLTKITTYNTKLYIDPDSGNPLSSVEEIYDLIAKTKIKNESAEAGEEIDLSKYIFAIPVFEEYLTTANDKIVTDYRIKKFEFYQTNYIDAHKNLIPLTVYFNTDILESTTQDQDYVAVNDTGYISDGLHGHLRIMPTAYRYDTYRNGGILNYIKHCGEVEITNNYYNSYNKIIKPFIKTFTNISQTELVWNFICFKDRNLPIIPFDTNTLYILQNSKAETVDLNKIDINSCYNILSNKTASFNEPLDKPVLSSDMYVNSRSPNFYYVRPIDYFNGVANPITSFDGLSGTNPGTISFTGISNNNTLNFDSSIYNPPDTNWPDNNLPGLLLNNYFNNIVYSIDACLYLNNIDKHLSPDTFNRNIIDLKFGLILDNKNNNREPLYCSIGGDVSLSTDYKITSYIDPDDPTKLCYNYPEYIKRTFNLYFVEDTADFILGTHEYHGNYTSTFHNFPLKNMRFLVFCNPSERTEFYPNTPYTLNPGDFKLELSLTLATNVDPVLSYTYGGSRGKINNTNIVSVPKIKYNYNNYPEGIFNYYHKNFGTYIENYIFNKYHKNTSSDDPVNVGSYISYDYDESTGRLLLSQDTIESQKKYKGFLNIIHDKKLRSIYAKQDTRNDYIVCPSCNGNEKINCHTCNNKRKISLYEYSGDTCPICNGDTEKGCTFCNGTGKVDYLTRYRCPSLDSEGIDHVDHTDKDKNGRCRICAGTKSIVRYYYLKNFEFCNLTQYNGNLPENIEDLNDVNTIDIINRVLNKYVKEKGSSTSEAYLNYIVRKYYGIPLNSTQTTGGSALDWDNIYPLYNGAAANLVFYILNGNFIKYKFWNGSKHIDVEYGYNYIYTTKTYTKEQWEKVEFTEETQKSTILYRIIEDSTDVDKLIGFYVILIPEINTQYTEFKYPADSQTGEQKSLAVQRIYFDKEWVYNNLLKDMTFNKFNIFTEKEEPIVAATQKLPEVSTTYDPTIQDYPKSWYAHIHDEKESTTEKRCETCNGVGKLTCSVCNGTGHMPISEGGQMCTNCMGTGKIICNNCDGTGDDPLTNHEPIELVYGKKLYIYSSNTYINTDNISFEINDQENPRYDGIEREEIDFEE